MHECYSQFIGKYKKLFERTQNSYYWGVEINPLTGMVDESQRWVLNDLTSSKSRVNFYLNNFSEYKKKNLKGETKVLLIPWQELLKAEVVRRTIESRLAPSSITPIITALRIIATISGKMPWDITQEDIIKAHTVALEQQPSGVIASRVLDCSRDLFDAHRISRFSPTYIKLKSREKKPRRKAIHVAKAELNDRINSSKLPQKLEFEALLKVLTMPTKRQVDKIIFPAIKLMIILGLRINEVCLIPVDWKREEFLYDQHGHLVFDDNGKPLRALYLRYFAEKQGEKEIYVPRSVPIPFNFQDHVEEMLESVIALTKELRSKLVLHEDNYNKQLFDNDYLNCKITPFEVPALIGAITDKISAGVGHHIYMPRERIMKQYNVPRYFEDKKIPWHKRNPLNNEFYIVRDVERALLKHFKTKLSEITPLVSYNGQAILKASQALFLLPRRGKAKEASSDWYYDWNKYLFVTPLSPSNIDSALRIKGKDRNIFEIYLKKEFKLKAHSLRHLRSSELIKAQVSDMVHAKTMGRQSLAQNYEYDHRSVKEQLDQLDITDEMLINMPIKARITLEKAVTGRLGGSITDTFNEVQKTKGIHEAIHWLSAHADAMHLTPYGACVANMVTNPCPKHLQCFMGCNHFVKDDRATTNNQLKMLLKSSEISLQQIKDGVINNKFSKAHLSHAKTIVKNLKKVLSAKQGEFPFENGISLYKDVGNNLQTAMDIQINLEAGDEKTEKN